MIDYDIYKKKADFLRDCGKEPKNIYLGKKQITNLKKWAEKNKFCINTTSESKPVFAGLNIFFVDADDHLECN